MQGVTEERYATNHLAKHLYKHVFASTRFSLQKNSKTISNFFSNKLFIYEFR